MLILFAFSLKKFAFFRIITLVKAKWGDELTAAKKIKFMLIQRNMTMKALAEELGIALSTLSGKMGRDNFAEKDLKKIADILNFDYEAVFTDRETGKQI